MTSISEKIKPLTVKNRSAKILKVRLVLHLNVTQAQALIRLI